MGRCQMGLGVHIIFSMTLMYSPKEDALQHAHTKVMQISDSTLEHTRRGHEARWKDLPHQPIPYTHRS